MSELELALVDLGRGLEWPPAPELEPAVRRRLAEPRPARPKLPARRTLALAFVVLAVALGAIMAVPQTRAAVLEFFGLRGVSIERVQTLPPVPKQSELGLGSLVELEAIKVPWVVLTPQALGEPDAVYYRPDPADGMVSLLYGSEAEPRALLTQFRASVDDAFLKKVVAGTPVERVGVDGQPGFWLSGEPHFFTYVDARGRFREETIRLAGNVLLWERGSLTFRLEAQVTKAEALRIARSLE